VFILDRWANDEFSKPFAELEAEHQGQLSAQLTTTPLHGHAALFGADGMLGIGLMCLRVLIPAREWKDSLLSFSFWTLNGGLMAMCVLSLLPVGLLQTKASVETGYWYARSSEFMQTDLMQTLR
jgi:nitric oxide reductase subunit B